MTVALGLFLCSHTIIHIFGTIKVLYKHRIQCYQFDIIYFLNFNHEDLMN